ncbi:hypothetical protein K3495_g6665 [Podosphaera aphanis]|nr:hypothetical protein K3495_g6665 [Podosphaera aphanis]
MSGPSDKARFYIEQAVPQLQEFKEKKIFTQEEIRELVKKRSNFEHRIHARGTKPVDFALYTAWEIGLEKLRQKRCQRLRIKSNGYSGQARIFNIFDRGTKKHPGDVTLWMSYLEYVRTCKSHKKFRSVVTAAIRLHPTKSELWLYAAKCVWESEADLNCARSYFQRGIRFCIDKGDLWIEYAKLEMIYLAKIFMRRKILQIDRKKPGNDNIDTKAATSTNFDGSEDMILIPNFEPNDPPSDPMEGVGIDTGLPIKDLTKTPALNGAIPLAIFDDARKQPFFCSSTAAEFFDMFAVFSQVPCQNRILQHVVDCMVELYPTDFRTWHYYTKQPTVGIDPLSPEFPAALGLSFEKLLESLEKTKDVACYSQTTGSWLKSISDLPELDAGIKTAVEQIMLRLKV